MYFVPDFIINDQKKGEIMTEVLEYVSNIGFPIVLSLFLITRIESKLEVLSESIKELSVVIQNMK